MIKIIFLDFDGVITTVDSKWGLDPNKLIILEKILKKTDAKLVISSSWRRATVEKTIEKLMDEKGHFMNNMIFPFCDRIIGVTDLIMEYGKHAIRGIEIKRWLEDNMKDKEYRYIILDDDTDMLAEQIPYFINTDGWNGLSNLDMIQAIKILNGKI